MKEEILKDGQGHTLGKIVQRGQYWEIQDKYGRTLGKYDPKTNKTLDAQGHTIGQGNLLTTLLK